jgi:hypothetical protein
MCHDGPVDDSGWGLIPLRSMDLRFRAPNTRLCAAASLKGNSEVAHPSGAAALAGTAAELVSMRRGSFAIVHAIEACAGGLSAGTTVEGV